MLFLLIIRHIHCYKSTFLLGLLGFRLENTLERIMQRSPFILYSYYGTILTHIKLVMQMINNQLFINGGGGGKKRKKKGFFYFSVLLRIITFAVCFYPLLHRNGIVQTLQNLLVRIIYHGIVQRIQVNKRSPFAAVPHPRTDDSNRYVVVACGGSPAVAWRI